MICADTLSLMDAALEGKKAGMWGFGAAMNPYQDDTDEHKAWEHARMYALSLRLSGHVLRRMP